MTEIVRTLKIGEWKVQPDLDQITRGSEQRELRPQIMDFLVYLADKAGEVVGNEELHDKLWAGKIVTQSSLYNALAELRTALGDDPRNPSYIETIPKRGYRLVAKVSDLTPLVRSEPAQAQGVSPDRRLSLLNTIALMGFLAVLVWVAVRQYGVDSQTGAEGMTSIPTRSVAVLPFADMSPSGDQAYFADGLSEEILNRLAQVPGLKVTGRTSSFALRDSDVSAERIGEWLGVAHVLEGSVRKDGDQFRITAQLINARDGFHVWSKVYEQQMTELFAVQDSIAIEIADALEVSLGSGGNDPASSLPAVFRPDLRAYDHYLRALELKYQASKDSFSAALEELDRALAIEPEYTLAHVESARTLIELMPYADHYRSPEDKRQASLRARQHIDTALKLNPNLSSAYTALALYWFSAEGPEEQGDHVTLAEEAIYKAIELNPRDAQAYNLMGWVLGNRLSPWGSYVEYLEKAVELEPLWLEPAMNLAYRLGEVPYRDHESEAIFQRLLEVSPRNPKVLWMQSKWLHEHGRLAESIRALEASLLEDPDFIPARQALAADWYSVGEHSWGGQNGTYMLHWAAPLNSERDVALQEVIGIDQRFAGQYPSILQELIGYMYLFFDRPEDTLRVLGYQLGSDHVEIPGSRFMLASYASPAMSLAVAFKMTGHEDLYRYCLDEEMKALDVRSDNGKHKNAKYWRIVARANALRGDDYAALQALERFVGAGPLDPRELKFPAYDGIRDSPRFQSLVEKMAALLNEERVKLGLDEKDMVAYQSAR